MAQHHAQARHPEIGARQMVTESAGHPTPPIRGAAPATRLTRWAGLLACALAVALPLGAARANPASANSLQLIDSGMENHILIESPALLTPARPGGNALALTIDGDRNGGLGQAWPASPLFAGLSGPGLLSQTGLDNIMSMKVTGTDNLFSAVQSGQGNRLSGVIIGTANAVAVSQTGHGNSASFTQNGTGNTLAISQSSW